MSKLNNRLMTEALNKRNEDVNALENGNEDLINLLEKCDDKIQKLEEDIRIEQMKAEKYEVILSKTEDFNKVDIESLDGRINFLVSTLEEYRKMLEEESDFDNTDQESLDNGLIDLDRLEEDNFITPVRNTKSLSYDYLGAENEKTLNTGTLSSLN
mmetsp:Transcript_22435/g.19931  ORF Transcript_22435/g.19931 Transcript_22435/m.19931 type:complete len:156 (+) Transcript_22435:537-1004(+)